MSAPLVLDDGLQFGLGVFETIAVEGGHGVLLQAHLARLARSAAALDLGELPARGVTREAVPPAPQCPSVHPATGESDPATPPQPLWAGAV